MVGPIHNPYIGPIDEGLISVPAMESNPKCPVKRIKAPDISCEGTTIKERRPNGGGCISGPQGSV